MSHGAEDSARALFASYLGVVPYQEALALQHEIARRVIDGSVDHDVLLLVQHPHVITLGRSYKGNTLVAPPELLRQRSVELLEVDRGGDVTYHGPGQLVGYPIFDLKRHRRDLHWYLRQLEEALIRALSGLGIAAGRVPSLTGVWVGQHQEESSPPRKIASIGVHARDWVTWHGFALNVTTDLSYFDLMIPCGISDVRMTSVAVERAEENLSVDDVAPRVCDAIGTVFQHRPDSVRLHSDLRALGVAEASSEG